MSIIIPRQSHGQCRLLTCSALRFWLLLLCFLPIVGCDGCRRTDDLDPQENPAEPEIAVGIMRTMPGHADSPLSYVKPAHWTAAYQDLKATRQDHRGVLDIEPLAADRRPLPVGNTDYSLVFSRPAALAKGQQKRFDLRLYMPPHSGEAQRGSVLQSSFVSRQGAMLEGMQSRVNTMPAYQYYFVVLTSRPAEFSYLGDDDWQRMRSDDLSDSEQNVHYRMVAPDTDGVIPVPDSVLQWTSIAYVLWDDLSPETLTADQQQALLDWVAWGGRVIVNGPASAASFRGTPLQTLLPIEASGSSELSGSELAPLLKTWQVPVDSERSTVADTTPAVIDQLTAVDSMPGAGGAKRDGAREVAGTNDLVVERNSGRGNVVITRFDLTSGWLRKWTAASGFYNGALLRRPPRDFRPLDFGVQTVFADDLEKQTRNPQLVSGLRILSRDLSLLSDTAAAIEGSRTTRPTKTTWISERFDPHVLGGIGAWNEKSGVSTVARDHLQQAAGISIPPARFVANSLIWYLAILVPLNYTIFRLLGRLEWAWIAVPVIAAGGAIWIARQAQLDIGFARSRSEIALLEIQGGHDRGHLTRYLALYNSLSTTYEANFDTREALLAPVSMSGGTRSDAGQQIRFRSGFSAGVQVQGINVPSNKTQLLHTEQMVALGGAISLDEDQATLRNDTIWQLEDVTVVRRSDQGDLESAPLGPLVAGESVELKFQSISGAVALGADVPEESQQLMRLVLSETQFPVGEVRLIGRIAGGMSGCEISPQASQVQAETVVVATLRYPSLPAARRDVRMRPEVQVLGEDFGEPAKP
ncbi:hypothetical protein EC9_36420 [Rosistilla ulvae]|uniref:Transmembrane protein n=1 Tax=Rosistilla ulvae TaxID=1930277 RepID=A0A517M3I9_9BACT|nr:hypothetical protein [Rosistilla ulvae]QDS89442.1 hypothetical protein EC9_36420 [Rosistilla ulvae]